MASQFQNRVVGAIVLVALGVIILPAMFDGNKKYYQSDFAAIPLIPSAPEDNNVANILPPVTQPLPDPVISEPVENIENSAEIAPVERSAQAGNAAVISDTTTNIVTNSTPARTTPSNSGQSQAPVGKAYVIQLGALTNAAKVEEIKATLSFANYTVFTIPTTAVQGKTTRIFVGPEASRQKLESTLPALEKLTGLKGVVKEHKVTN